MYFNPNATDGLIEVGPKVLASGTVTEVTESTRLHFARIVNRTAGSITVTITDAQQTPIAILPPTTLPQNSWVTVTDFKIGQKCLNGIIVTCSDAGLEGYIQARQL